MPDTVHLLPLDAIAEDALPRDRTATDPSALIELQTSIFISGLRMPIEVFELDEPDGPHRYGLISGYRRLAACRAIHAETLDKARHAAIPAFIRRPDSITAALTAMVEENAIRTDVSPWERAMLAVTARNEGYFLTIEEAVGALYLNFGRDKRRRMLTLAHLCEELGGWLTDPETLSQRQLLRLAAAVAGGFRDVIRHALGESSRRDAASQWQILLPILAEAEAADPVEPKSYYHASRPDRPRRLLYPRNGVNIRRERTRDGWCLHVTGRDATGMFMDGILDEIERWCSPG